MTLAYINNIVKENNLFLNSNYKKNNNLFLKELSGTYNQNCIAKPLLFTEDKFVVYSALNKFNSFLIKRKHMYKRGFYSADLFAKDELTTYRVPSTFVYNYDVAFIGKYDENHDILVDTQYHNNVSTSYYKRLRKILIKSFYKSEFNYLWKIFMKKYNLNFALNSLKSYEITTLRLSKSLIQSTIRKISRKLTLYRLLYAYRNERVFPIMILRLRKPGVDLHLGNNMEAFAYYDKVVRNYFYINKNKKLLKKYCAYRLFNILNVKLLKLVSYSIPDKHIRRGQSRFVVGFEKDSTRFALLKLNRFKKNKSVNKYNFKSFNKDLKNKFKYKFNSSKKNDFKSNKPKSNYIKPKSQYKFLNKPKKHYLN